MIALDTNLLVYAHRQSAPDHSRAKAAIEDAAASRAWGIPLPCISEFWYTVTRASIEGGPSSGNLAEGFVRALVDAGAIVLGPRIGFGFRLMEEAHKRNIRGARIFDLQVALVALDGRATEIWTHDADFPHIPGLKVVDPLIDGKQKRPAPSLERAENRN